MFPGFQAAILCHEEESYALRIAEQWQKSFWQIGELPYQLLQSLSCVQLFVTPWIGARQASLSLLSPSLHKLTSSDATQPSHPVIPFSSCPQSFPASGSFPVSQLFASGGQSIGVSASALVLPMNMLISFRMDWLDLLAVQGTLKSLLRHHSLKASVLQCSDFMVQLSHLVHDYWKNHSFDYTDLCWQSDISAF